MEARPGAGSGRGAPSGGGGGSARPRLPPLPFRPAPRKRNCFSAPAHRKSRGFSVPAAPAAGSTCALPALPPRAARRAGGCQPRYLLPSSPSYSPAGWVSSRRAGGERERGGCPCAGPFPPPRSSSGPWRLPGSALPRDGERAGGLACGRGPQPPRHVAEGLGVTSSHAEEAWERSVTLPFRASPPRNGPLCSYGRDSGSVGSFHG